MNFAYQFFYANELIDVGASAPKTPGFSDGEEHDPFWQSEEKPQEAPAERKPSVAIHHVANAPRALIRRNTLIEPERLRDFGEELAYYEPDEDQPKEKEHVNSAARSRNLKAKPLPEALLFSECAEPSESSETRETHEQNGHCVTDSPATPTMSSSVDLPRAPPTTTHKPPFEPACSQPEPASIRFEDISAAAFKMQSGIQKTPCTYSRLSRQYGMELYLKKEYLQYTGSAKERGTLYLLTSLTLEQQKKGVIVATDCNYSMAVAHHAVELNIPVLIIMPASCSPQRLRTYRDYGAMVISYGSTPNDSLRHARHLAEQNGYLFLEEDDNAAYLAGLGTVGMEIHEQVPKLDAVIVPAGRQCSLLVGTAAAIKHLNSHIMVIGVEPEGFPLLQKSGQKHCPVSACQNTPYKKLYGDLDHHTHSSHKLQLAKTLVDQVISVREDDCLVAMLRFQEYERCTVDTEGAMGLAAILAGQLPELKGKRVAVVVSSANMELGMLRQCLDRALVLDDRVSRFTVQLGDVPGDMAKLLDTLAREDVRLLDVCQRRHNDRADLFTAQVECVVETRDKAQSAQLRRTLLERYPTLCWLDR